MGAAMNNAARTILTEQDIARVMTRLAHEIIERNQGTGNLVLIGVRTRGVFLAKRLQNQIQEIDHCEIPLGSLDITLYRDDLGEIGANPIVKETEITFDVNQKIVVLIDDVLFTGRTVRAALDALTDFGRPKAIQLAVLVDRGHRELPIKADYVGKNIPTSLKEQVILHLKEKDNCDEVILVERGS